MVIVMGYAKLAAGEIDRLKDAAARQIETTRAEDGCEHYSFARDLLHPDTLIISERWRDGAALSAHAKAPHMTGPNRALSDAKILGISVKAYENGEVRTLIGS